MTYPFPYNGPLFYLLSVPAETSAVLLFLACYVSTLVARAKKADPVQPVPVPMWLGIMYPSWLDRLSIRQIVAAFFQSLILSVVAWTVLTIIVLAALGRVSGG